MILVKLQEALAEIGSQRKALDEVEVQLRSMISRLSGVPNITSPVSRPVAAQPTGRQKDRDKLDDVAEILRAEGKPLHITIIAERLSLKTGRKIPRTTIEPGINRHIAKTKVPRIAKFAPSTYGLPEWKVQPTLAHIA